MRKNVASPAAQTPQNNTGHSRPMVNWNWNGGVTSPRMFGPSESRPSKTFVRAVVYLCLRAGDHTVMEGRG